MKQRTLLPWLVAALLLAPVAFVLAQQPPASAQTSPAQDKPAAAPAADMPQVIPVPPPQGTRLCLKDGNYLLVREYKVKSGRVSYWSVERGEWEEIPDALVDWDATHRSEAEDAARKKQIDEKLDEIKKDELASSLTVDTSLEVAPGVFLPDTPGFYIVASGSVASLSQDMAESHRGKKRLLLQVITPIPVVPTKHNVELKGERAKLRIRDSQPEFYFRTPDGREPEIMLVRARVHGGSRLISEIETNIARDTRVKEDAMSLQQWQAAEGTYRYTLGQKLAPGEYAFIEYQPESGMDYNLWDFGVDAAGSKPHKN